jgi:hypothetical protein
VKFLSPALIQEPELYRVIAQTIAHSHAGVGEAAVTPRELTSGDFFSARTLLPACKGR